MTKASVDAPADYSIHIDLAADIVKALYSRELESTCTDHVRCEKADHSVTADRG